MCQWQALITEFESVNVVELAWCLPFRVRPKLLIGPGYVCPTIARVAASSHVDDLAC